MRAKVLRLARYARVASKRGDKRMADALMEAASLLMDVCARAGAGQSVAEFRGGRPEVFGLVVCCKNEARDIYRLPGGRYKTMPKGGRPGAGWYYLGTASHGAKAAEISGIISKAGVETDGTEGRPVAMPGRVGSVVRAGKPADMANRVLDVIGKEPRDVYRMRDGSLRVVAADRFVDGEFLGRFNDGASFDDVLEAIA